MDLLFSRHMYGSKNGSLYKSSDSFAFPKRSPMVPFFNHAYKKIRETGSWLRMKERWADAENTGQCDQVTDYHPISIYKIISLLILLLLGIGTSVSILVFENIITIIIGFFKLHGSSINMSSISSLEPINSNKKVVYWTSI